MVEKNQGGQRRIEVQEIDPGEALKRIFTGLNELRNLRKVSVTALALSDPFAVYPETLPPKRSIRVNPAAKTEDGKPRIVIIDAHYLGQHMQQIVLEAEWSGEEPTIVTNDPSKITGATQVLPYQWIEALASGVIEHKLMHAKGGNHNTSTEEERGTYFQMPDSYSPRIQ